MRILEVHEIDYVEKVVFEFQEFPEALAARDNVVAVMDYDTRSTWSDLRRWGLGPKDVTIPGRLDPERPMRLLRQIGPPVPVLHRLWSAFWAPVVVRRVFAAFDPEVVLLYAVPTSGWAIVREARRRGVPVVFRSFDILSQLVPKLIEGPVHLLERWTYARCDRVLVSSPLIARYVERLSGGATDTELLRLSVDVTRFTPGPDSAGVRARAGIPADSRVAVFVGTLVPFTGLMRMLDQWDDVRRREPRAHLHIVGGGPQEDELRQRVSRLTEPGSVTMTGMVPYRDVPDHIRAADVGICPFEILPVTREINPVKVVGYLACGLPTVCTALDGTMAVLPHETSGVLYAEPGGAFADVLVGLLDDETESRRLGETGRRWAVEHHSIDAVVTQLERDLAGAIEHLGTRARHGEGGR
jgi:glycosyltransferase involved in cell wall biosynthesis